ncbi:carboxyl-terminal-processing peptidase 1, chloroplastic isoform X2 [Apium graveolens]|uniref:carboxyl-terminal-processing peptidase 1, chloroplastic isoform X2 n=1 Tax=Apium graveolens TaxID=4045 RepID=UPI003D7AE276
MSFIFTSSTSLPFSPTKPPPISAVKPSFPMMGFPQPTFLLAGALSLGLVISTPSCIALESSTTLSSSAQLVQSSPEVCREEESEKRDGLNAPELRSDEGVVEQAWEIVNESFLDPSGKRWSPQSWLQKKEDLSGTSIKTGTKAHDLIRRMLASLGDPYTRFLPPPEFSKMARYDMTGIGINLREVPDDNGEVKLKVLGLILDGPAHTAGVQQGDELLSVNGVDVRGKSAFEASSLIQGPSETLVNIMVKHGNCGPEKSFEVERQLVARTPVFYRLEQVEDSATSVGYVRLKEFNALARKDIVTAIQRLQNMGASYFILDLRDNRGGLVQAGIEIAKLFMNQGETVIYTAGRETQYQNNIVADSAPLFTSPVIILVNKNTASASEIVASALHDNCRAVLVGEKTFGKGLIQSVFELQDGSGVVVTIGKYITPNHLDINGNGIEPDFKKFPGWSEVAQQLNQCHRPQGG